MVAEASTALVGMTEISGYMRRSEKTMLDLIRFEGFPARKVGGIWESDRLLADDWRRKRIIQGNIEGPMRERAI